METNYGYLLIFRLTSKYLTYQTLRSFRILAASKRHRTALLSFDVTDLVTRFDLILEMIIKTKLKIGKNYWKKGSKHDLKSLGV